MEEKLDKILEMQRDHSESLARLETSVMGDEEAGIKGLVKKQKEHSEYIEEDKKFKAKVVGGATVFGIIWTLLIKFWDKIFM